MPHRISVPFPLLEAADDDNESPLDSSHSTPRSSFVLYLDPFDHGDLDLRLRPLSFDSGYFSMMGKESLTSKSFKRKSSGTDLRVPLLPINNATDATQESPGREGVIRSLLRKKKKSMTSPPSPDLGPFSNGLLAEDDPVPQIQWTPFKLPSPRSKPRDPSVEAFEQQDRFVVRRGMRHHPYSRGDAPYMLAYDRTLLDKYGTSHNRFLLF